MHPSVRPSVRPRLTFQTISGRKIQLCMNCILYSIYLPRPSLSVSSPLTGEKRYWCSSKADSPSAFQPICLLNESKKLFERVISGPGTCREWALIYRTANLDSDGDARQWTLLGVFAPCQGQSSPIGGLVLTVSLDIVNAFGTLA